MKIAVATHSHSSVDSDISFNHLACKLKWNKMYPSQLLFLSLKGMKNASAREKLTEAAINQGCSHILFIDDDHFIHESLLPLLLESADSAIVSGIICKRAYPFPQVGWVVNPDGMFAALDLPLDGRIYEVGVCAFGCTLINLEKLQKLDKPYFQDTCSERANGKIGNLRSDVVICNRFRENGEQVWIDSRIQVGHKTDFGIVYPHTAKRFAKFIDEYEDMMKEDTNGYYQPSKMAEQSDTRSSDGGEVKCQVELENN